MILIFQLFQTADEDASFSLALAASRLRPKTKAGTAARTTAATIAMMRTVLFEVGAVGVKALPETSVQSDGRDEVVPSPTIVSAVVP